jgi:hypothetical protein
MLKAALRRMRRAKRNIGEMLLKDWSGCTVCGRLVHTYLDNTESDHSIFTLFAEKLDEIVGPLEGAAEAIFQVSGHGDDYMEAVGLVRISQQLEASLAEVGYIAEHGGRDKVREEFVSKSLFFQY